MPTYREGLPPVAVRMRKLRVDERGYPIPWFVADVDGKPDFRVANAAKWRAAVVQNRCWLCGELLGKFKTFVLGPMCAITRTTSEPPCHHDCAEFAARACPFMILPRAKYRAANLPAECIAPAGEPIMRNPGCVGLWSTLTYSAFTAMRGNKGMLITVGDPVDVEWFAEARVATRAEVWESINSGLPLLLDSATRDGPQALQALRAACRAVAPWLPGDSDDATFPCVEAASA